MDYDVLIVGAGFAGSTLAQKFSEDGKKVLVIDKREHIGGNMYEELRNNGVRIHKYGPHIFHTNDKEVLDYLKRFSGFTTKTALQKPTLSRSKRTKSTRINL